MPKHDSPYVVGDHWLDKRRDGRSPDIWQIAHQAQGKSVRYRSTRCSDLEDAKRAIEAHVLGERISSPDNDESPLVFSLLKSYWREHGCKVVSPDQIKASMRAFLGFLESQDDLGAGITADRLNADLFHRFMDWRRGPHEWKVTFLGHTSNMKSQGVKGETIQRNLDDLSAAFNHNVKRERMKPLWVPRVPAADRSPPRDRVLSPRELGMIVWYSRHKTELYQWVSLMLGTAVRPEAAMAFDPTKQLRLKAVDLHPADWRKTTKRNPVVPLIEPLRPILENWVPQSATSHKTAWRTMRRVLGLDSEVYAKTIRHTVATMLLDYVGDSPHLIESLLGHRVLHRTTSVYAKWSVAHMEPLVEPLTNIWDLAQNEADRFGSVHSLSTTPKGRLTLVKKAA